VLELPEDTFSDEDRETAADWRDAYPSLDFSDSDLVGGTRADRRAATLDAAAEAAEDALAVLPSWLKWAVVAIVALLGSGVFAYVFGQLFTIEI